MRAAMRSTNSYEQLIEIGERLEQRLQSRRAHFQCSDASRRLNERLVHLRARAGLPENTLSRMPPVIRELFAGRYHCYSNGFLSAVKDLFQGNTRKPGPNEI
jgi:hypothetical protein